MHLIKHSEFDLSLLHKRSLIAIIFDQLKNLCQIEHSRHRKIPDFIVNCL
ncbi:hypothetical protein CJJ18_01805 [Candidatus Williamhamiltonella defendens]|uniref:Transposase DDE domain-containing protein n=1 Tax=Candidatus Williamhamiltonella defendens TaxID=138072 RepID=A0AAC9VJ76_9ENTR|nr:hypothetical protein CJJ18_01805 [Candidatus Hamiltonella defensa]AWK16002.1 hypothetical protein CCS40_01790 [Candidatus Hamiltonella defensa]